MKVLRSNKDSVMAMLEAFVYDPLINWRLLNTTDATSEIVNVRDAEPKEGMLKQLVKSNAPCFPGFGCSTLPAVSNKLASIEACERFDSCMC